MTLPKELQDFIKDSPLEEITIGCSDTKVMKVKKDNKEYFIKIGKANSLQTEYQKLVYLQDKLPVPKIVMHNIIEEDEYIVSTKIPGEMLCSKYYMAHPSEGINIIADALNIVQKVDIKDCPINTSLDYRLNLARQNIAKGLIKDENIEEENLKKYKSKEGILKYLEDNKFKEELCFSHGDTSLPNMFAHNNSFSGFIDVGECGISDKWFDIAITIKSIIRNYGEEYVNEFLEKINVKFDKFKYNYYMLLMELML